MTDQTSVCRRIALEVIDGPTDGLVLSEDMASITIGRNARVGANAVVVKDVADGVTVVGIPAKPADLTTSVADRFTAYGTPTEDTPAREERALAGLLNEVSALRRRVEELEKEQKRRDVSAPPEAGEDADVDGDLPRT